MRVGLRIFFVGGLLSYRALFDTAGRPVNAVSLLPGMLRDFADIGDMLAHISPRKALVAAGVGAGPKRPPSVDVAEQAFTSDPQVLLDWLSKSP